ncbi:MAG: hydroxyacid dehydrogenase [Acidobacteria bacterium]|nr:hydroxyacid dehydrogenase [Acidobacteriota bacterium]
MSDILISENIIGADIDALRERFTVVLEPELWKHPERLSSFIPEYRALIVRNQTQVTRELIEAGKQLRVIARTGVGLDNVDLQAASDHGIVVAFTPDQNTNSVAELAIGLILALARKITTADYDTKRGGWNRQRFTGIEISGKTLGLLGFGRIGVSTALKAEAQGMVIVACDPFIDPKNLMATGLRVRMMSLEEMLPEADFVSCHLPKTKETASLLGYRQFCLMKPAAFFINTSRGGVVDENGLIRALQEKKIAGAALDVREQEPPLPGQLAEMDNVILTPHVAGLTIEANHRVITAVCRDVSAVLNGEAAENFANFSRPK